MEKFKSELEWKHLEINYWHKRFGEMIEMDGLRAETLCGG